MAHNSSEDTITLETVGSLHQEWTALVRGAVRDPIVSDKAMHFVSGNRLYGLDKATGAQLWSAAVEPAGDAVMGPAVAFGADLWTGGGHAYGNSYESQFLDPATGTVVGEPSDDGFVDGVRLNQSVIRRVNWQGPGTTIVTFTFSDTGSPSTEWEGFSQMTSTPASVPPPLTLGDDFVYQARAVDGKPAVAAYSTKEPQQCPAPIPQYVCPSWTAPLEGPAASSVVVAPFGAAVYVGTDSGRMWAFNGDTGAVLWTTYVESAVSAAPALADGRLYVPTSNGNLWVLNADTGNFVWGYGTGSRITVQPAVAGELLYVGSADGTIRAFDAAGGCGGGICPQLWSDQVSPTPISGAPAVSQGQLFVGTEDGKVAAYGLHGR